MTSPFVRRRRLAEELRALREAKGMTAEQLSQLIYHSRTKVSRLENAHIRPDLAEVMKILDILDVTGEKWNEVVRIARDAAERGWWDSYGDAMGSRQRLYADLEYSADSVRGYNQLAMPGVLQTPEFTQALVQLDKAGGPIDYRPERMAEARLQRQRTVFRPNGPALEYILEEFVVRRIAVPEVVMLGQLKHLVEKISASPQLTVRVLPIDARIIGVMPPRSTFTLYAFPDHEDPPMAVADTINADLVHTEPSEVARYTELYDRLRQASLSTADSLAFLMKSVQRLSDEAGVHT